MEELQEECGIVNQAYMSDRYIKDNFENISNNNDSIDILHDPKVYHTIDDLKEQIYYNNHEPDGNFEKDDQINKDAANNENADSPNFLQKVPTKAASPNLISPIDQVKFNKVDFDDDFKKEDHLDKVTTNVIKTVGNEKSKRSLGNFFRSLRDKRKIYVTETWASRRVSDGCNLEEVKRNFENRLNTMDEGAREAPHLARSDYSLVSCTDLTPGAVQLWMELPEEVRYDPALAPFKRLYDKQNKAAEDATRRKISVARNNRLPSVSSAPHLQSSKPEANQNGNTKRHSVSSESPEPQGDCSPDEIAIKKKLSKMASARYYIKMTLLLGCWIFFTVIFMMYNEKTEVVRHSYIEGNRIKSYYIENIEDKLNLKVQLEGPFLSPQQEESLNSTQKATAHKIKVWLEKLAYDSRNGSIDTDLNKTRLVQQSEIWGVYLMNESDIDFSQAESRSNVLKLPFNASTGNGAMAIRMRSSVDQITPFTLSYTVDPLNATTGVIYSCILLCGLYVLIIFEVINRTMAAIVMSTTSIAVLAIVGERPSVEEIITWLDVETLLLLFSMMVLVAIMAETGMFDYLAVFAFQVTKGKLWPLINLLCIITAVISTVLDNVTTVLLMSPVTMRLCEAMGLHPVPILIAMVLYSNIGGTATPVGDPPNVIIASNKDVIQAGINFTTFTLHMTLGILFVGLQTYFQLRFMYRDTSRLRPDVPRDIQELRNQISIWRRAEASLPHLSKDQEIVRQALEKKVRKLNNQLELRVKETIKRACPKDSFQTTLDDLKKKYKVRDKVLLIKTSVAIAFVVLVFFLHSIPEFNRVSLGWTALLGAILLLILADREDLEPILHRVEWSTLLFFAALFVLMEALSRLGLIEYIGGLTETIILQVDEGARLAVAIVLILWVSGVTSAFVDNIPLTTMMIRIVTSLGANPTLKLPIQPLVWALSLGACLGGNGTLIGASANVVCAGVSEQHGYKISFVEFFKVGFPIMVGHLIVATVYLIICHCAFTWH